MNRLVLSSACFVLLFAMPAAAATLAPHRAYYDLEAKRLDGASGIAAIKGKLAYEISGSACAGFAVSYRMAQRVQYDDNGPQTTDNQLTSWESGDGLDLDITQKQFLNGKLTSDSRIKVTRAGADAPGKGLITRASTQDFEIGAGVMFPSRFQMKLIDAALKGDSRDVTMLFEGSDDDKPTQVITFIGAKRSVSGVPANDAGLVSGASAWPVSMSYYAANGVEDAQPAYQANFLMLDNGVSTELVLDYGSYALSGKLTKLDMLKPETCP